MILSREALHQARVCTKYHNLGWFLKDLKSCTYHLAEQKVQRIISRCRENVQQTCNFKTITSEQRVIMHIALGWTPIRMHDTSNLNMDFHQVDVFGFDMHLLFVLALTPLFPWSMCSLSARVHDL